MIHDSNINVGFPFGLDGRGRVRDPGHAEHVRQMIELILFTSPGERANRPEFGCGLLDYVFGSGDAQESGALSLIVQAALQEWLGEVIDVQTVAVRPLEGSLSVRVEYKLLDDGESHVAVFEPREMPWDV